jgi:hypothetical protein
MQSLSIRYIWIGDSLFFIVSYVFVINMFVGIIYVF